MSKDASKGGASPTREVATLASGCFWCTEAVFNEIRGVERVESGYSGGTVPSPNYEQVCTGTTGHAETVQVTFDPTVISFKDILQLFFTTHDPTTQDRQGADVGTQYRSAIFYHNADQRSTAEQVIKEINASKVWKRPIVTEVSPFKTFYKAEDYHQNFYQNNPSYGYCKVVIDPKIAKLRKQYQDMLKKT